MEKLARSDSLLGATRATSVDRTDAPAPARKRRLGRCVHCLEPAVEITDDHVFPLSWFPDNAPLELERWKAPACRPCNGNLGAIEQSLLLRICLCLDPSAPETAGLTERALRALDPSEGKSPKDQHIRAGLLKKVWGQTELGPHAGQVLAPFHERWGRPPEEQRAINVPQDLIRRFGEKMARGLHYALDGAYIEPPLAIGVFPHARGVGRHGAVDA